MNTIINLEQSTFAHSFNDEELIHKEEFDRVMKLINQKLASIHPNDINEGMARVHYHNTISVFGERGSGKTSFLYSVIDRVDKNKVEVLNIVDPTLIEEKEHIFLLVVSQINEAVKRKLTSSECKLGSKSFQQRNTWNIKLQRLAKGLPTLEKVGAGHNTKEWQSHEFIMERGLSCVDSAFNLEHDFHMLVKYALEILEKEAFMLVLDDIDVDMRKGWDVLEMLRRYITTPQIITLLSGNLKLYSLNVRKNQWKQLFLNKEYEPDKGYTQIVNELEGQYLLKVLKPENRVHLNSLAGTISYKKQQYIINPFRGEELTIQEVYKLILEDFGIKGSIQQSIFLDYLLSLSVRTQIQFIASNEIYHNIIDSIDAFLSRLYAAEVNVSQAVSNVLVLNIIIQRYLEEQKTSPDLYLLTPSSHNEDQNACLMAFSLIFAKQVETDSFLIFDYFIRMGYMRNVMKELSVGLENDFYSRTALSHQMSLKDNVGLSIGYCYEQRSMMTSHVALHGFSEKDKKGVENKTGRFDHELRSRANRAQEIIAYLPLCVLRFTERGGSKLFYSFYNLMAAISEILKVSKGDDCSSAIKMELNKLSILHSYPTRRRTTSVQKNRTAPLDFELIDNEVIESKDTEDDGEIEKLVDYLSQWAKEYNETIPPYLIGKIANRTFLSIQKIAESNLGDQMHRIVIAFLNASLIEELSERYKKSVKGDSIDKLRIDNAINDDNVFFYNIDFVSRNKALDSIGLTIWMAKCPLIWCFMKPGSLDRKTVTRELDGKYEVFAPFKVDYEQNINVYDLLRHVYVLGGKKTAKPFFSGSIKNISKTVEILKSAGVDPLSILSDKRSPDIIAEEIYQKGLFEKKTPKSSIKAFRDNYYKVFPKEETDTLKEDWVIATEAVADNMESEPKSSSQPVNSAKDNK